MKEKAKTFLPKFLTIFALFVLLLIPQISKAVDEVDESEAEGGSCTESIILPPCTCTGNCRIEDILVLGVNIFQVAVSLVGALAVGLIIVGGVVLLASGGNTQRVERGKKIISGTFVGFLVVVGSWLIVNFIYYASTGGSNRVFGRSWFELKEYPPIQIIPAIYTRDDEGNEVVVTPECSDLPAVALAHGVPYPERESDDLMELKDCIQTRIDMSLVDTGQIYTYDRNHESCNYTRGAPVCENSGRCSHSNGSCHYGGGSGGNGAEAVDYNARDNSLHGETVLYNQIKAAVDGPCNAFVGYDDLEIYYKEDGSYNHAHTHLSTTACDAN